MSAVIQGLGCVSHFLQEQRTPCFARGSGAWGVGLPWSRDSKRSLKCIALLVFFCCEVTLRHKQSWKNNSWNGLGLTHAEKEELFFSSNKGKVVSWLPFLPDTSWRCQLNEASILRSVHFPESWDINQHWASKLQKVTPLLWKWGRVLPL